MADVIDMPSRLWEVVFMRSNQMTQKFLDWVKDEITNGTDYGVLAQKIVSMDQSEGPLSASPRWVTKGASPKVQKKEFHSNFDEAIGDIYEEFLDREDGT